MNAPPDPPKPYPWLTEAVRRAGRTTRNLYWDQARQSDQPHIKAAATIAGNAVQAFAAELIKALEQQTPPDARPKCTCRFINQGLPDAVHAVDPECLAHRKGLS